MAWSAKIVKQLPRKRSTAEDDLQMKCADYLDRTFPDLLWWHTANERATSPQAGARLKRKGVKAGVPDIIIVDWGVAIELKQGKNRTTPEQNRILRKFRDCNWTTYVVYEFREFLNAIAKHAEMSVDDMDKQYYKNKFGYVKSLDNGGEND